LEARVVALEGLLSKQQQHDDSAFLSTSSDDRNLSEHLQVTVRKNRELRVELEVARADIAKLQDDKRKLLDKLSADQASMEALLRDTSVAKDSLQISFKALMSERQELQQRVAGLMEENASLKKRNALVPMASAQVLLDGGQF
jgi:hypothetical protein